MCEKKNNPFLSLKQSCRCSILYVLSVEFEMVELPNEEIIVDENIDVADREREDVRRLPNVVRRRKYALVQQTLVATFSLDILFTLTCFFEYAYNLFDQHERWQTKSAILEVVYIYQTFCASFS